MKSVPLRRPKRIRLVIDVAVLIALLSGVGVWAGIWRRASAGAPPIRAPAADIQRAIKWLSSLPPPVGFRRDPTGTACDGSATPCYIATLHADTLFGELRAALIAHGASIPKTRCNPQVGAGAGVSGFVPADGRRCHVEGSFRGVIIVVLAGDRFALGHTASAWGGAIEMSVPIAPRIDAIPTPDRGYRAQPVPKINFVPPRNLLEAFPRAWHVKSHCTFQDPVGWSCDGVRALLPQSYRAAELAWLRMLVTAGYDVSGELCYPAHGPRRPEQCVTSAVRYRGSHLAVLSGSLVRAGASLTRFTGDVSGYY